VPSRTANEARGGLTFPAATCGVPLLREPWQRRTNVWHEVTSPARGFRPLTSDRQRLRYQLAERPLAGRVERKLNMRHYPDLYFFLRLLAGLAASLAIESIQKFCRPKPPVVEPRRSVEPPSPPKHPCRRARRGARRRLRGIDRAGAALPWQFRQHALSLRAPVPLVTATDHSIMTLMPLYGTPL
jgi:hypothetical protein